MKRLALVISGALILAVCADPTSVEQDTVELLSVRTTAQVLAERLGDDVEVFGTGSKDGKAVLVLSDLPDVNAPSTSALVRALVDAGNVVAVRPGPDDSWNGSNPSLDLIEVVIHLNGANGANAMGGSGRRALAAFVRAGGTYVGSQWNGYELAKGHLSGMETIVLQGFSGKIDNCLDCAMTYTTIPGLENHPLLADVPGSFTFEADAHAGGPQIHDAENPSTVLMRGTEGGPAVLVRNVEKGRVVSFAHAANYGREPETLKDSNIQRLYVNAAGWNGEPVLDTNRAPIADAGGPYYGLEGSVVAFDGSDSSDPDRESIKYHWDFGDGTTGSGRNPKHAYVDNGTYTVTVVVRDPSGASATSSGTATIANVAPAVAGGARTFSILSTGAETTISSGEEFQLTQRFADPGIKDDPWTYSITWDDGTVETGSTSDQRKPIRARHQFCTARDYVIRTAVKDKDGGTEWDDVRLKVTRRTIQLDISPGHITIPPIHPRQENENGDRGGVIPVDVLIPSDVNAAQIDLETVSLGDGVGAEVLVRRRNNGTIMAALEDLDGDGNPDLKLHFERSALIENGDLHGGTTELVLQADLLDGCTQIGGSQEVTVTMASTP